MERAKDFVDWNVDGAKAVALPTRTAREKASFMVYVLVGTGKTAKDWKL